MDVMAVMALPARRQGRHQERPSGSATSRDRHPGNWLDAQRRPGSRRAREQALVQGFSGRLAELVVRFRLVVIALWVVVLAGSIAALPCPELGQ